MNKLSLKRCLFVGAVAMSSAFAFKVYAQQYQVAACDWMMLKRQKIGEFQLAKDIQADGIEMDMGPLGKRVMFDNKLREEHFRQLFRRTADSLGIAVPSMAMSGFFGQSFLMRENYRELIADCLQSMDVMGAKVAFLPLGGSGDEWKQAGAAHDEMVRRLHDVGEMALQQGKVIAVRTSLDAQANLQLLKEVKSQGIKIYYNLQDAVDQGLDPCKELKKLGSDNIAQIHASLTDSVTLDRDPRIDLRQVKKTLDKMRWKGWLVVERSRDAQDTKNVRGNFGRNVAYLKEIFKE
ncbi:MAG: TIM barrel protein [Prevotella sp.]|nr:TIM barrel protein [Prevotella sp.]